MPLPDYHYSKRTAAALRLAMRYYKQAGVSETEQRRMLNDYILKNKDKFPDAPFEYNKNQTNDFINGKSIPIPRQLFLNALWNTLVEGGQPELLERAWGDSDEAKEIDVELLPKYLHAFISGTGSPLDERFLTSLKGRYIVYRPFFLDPERIMVLDMTCGVDDDARFSIEMAWPFKGKKVDERVDGYMVPYTGNCLFMGMIHDAGSPFIFILTDFPKRGKAVSEGTGVVLVGAEGTTPSAYPIHMARVADDDEVIIGTFTKEDLLKVDSAFEDIIPIMERGFTKWRSLD